MKKTLIVLLFFSFTNNAIAGFIHPMEYKPSDEQEVIDYIEKNTRLTYCRGVNKKLCSESIIRFTENAEILSFKQLMATDAIKKAVIDGIIREYCENGPQENCSYSFIKLMYDFKTKPLKLTRHSKLI